jgi:hypothetical protein
VFTGTPAELRRREQKAGEYAAQIADLLNKIDDLQIGVIIPNRIAGPAFTIRPANGRWAVQH